ncbi:MAG: PAS domain-containing protein [Desulfobulbaceae bacterium]|nr:PAS domain-containing protein [Desulfobulbaceae bacterium]
MGEFNQHRSILRNLPIRWKLTILLLALMIGMGAATSILIERRLTRLYNDDLLEDATSIGQHLANNCVTPIITDDLGTINELLHNAMQGERDIRFIYVLREGGQLLGHSFPGSFPAELFPLEATASNGARGRAIIWNNEPLQVMAFPIQDGRLGSVHLALSNSSLSEPLIYAKQELSLLFLLITLMGLVVIYLLNRLISRPLQELAAASTEIGQGRFELRLRTSSDEIGLLAQAFNRMAHDLHDSHTKRLESEKALQASEALHRSLVDNIDLGFTLISKDFEVIFTNNAQARMFNKEPESFLGRKCHQVFENRNEVCPHCPGVRAMQSGQWAENHATAVREDGSKLHVLIKSYPFRNEQQEITGFIEIASDITNQRDLDEALQRIKNIETIGQLAGGLAHDFNNLLTAILGNIELAKLGIDPNQDSAARLDSATKACDQARRLTNQLLTFAKGGLPVKKRAYLPPILDEACHFTLSGSSIRYILDAPQNLWPVEIDNIQMSQVIHNLLNNAREAMAANPTGKIFVVAENIELAADSKLPVAPGLYVKVDIVDEGLGIKPEILGKIFNPYFSTKELGTDKGTGLGLTICHSIISKHGGFIAIDSKEKLGTTCTFYLPAADKIRAAASPLPEVTGESSAGTPMALKILILEDEEEVAHIATVFLTNLRHHGEVAGTGNQALNLFQEAKASEHPFDLLILDLTIRGGMGGEELLRKIREIDHNIPAIVSSGYTDDPIMTDCQSHDFQAALPKPFNQAALRAAIAQAFSRPVGNRQSPPAASAQETPPGSFT